MESLDKEMSAGSGRVVFIFNEMRDDYDDMRDLWYAWLFSRLHFFITKHLICKWGNKPKRVVDIGCGTGLQSFLYAVAGADVIGVDIADGLVSVAREKATKFQPGFPILLFPPYLPFVTRYDKFISSLLASTFSRDAYIPPRFEVADAIRLPFQDETFDHVNCCGSTLSFIGQYNQALAEISRVLKPEGTFVLEVEAKYNLDLVWTALDPLLFGALGFETGLKEALGIAFSDLHSHVTVDYPFGDERNPVYMDIRLFSGARLLRELDQHALGVEKTLSIHSVTNLVPSTFLDSCKPSKSLVRIFTLLARIEETCPVQLPGCSLVIFGTKAPPPRNRSGFGNGP